MALTRPSPPLLSVVVVGAGIAGLTTAIGLRNQGHSVRVLERHASCQAPGAPIRTGPNASRVLISFGMEDALTRLNVNTKQVVFRRWDDGKALMKTVTDNMATEYGAP